MHVGMTHGVVHRAVCRGGGSAAGRAVRPSRRQPTPPRALALGIVRPFLIRILLIWIVLSQRCPLSDTHVELLKRLIDAAHGRSRPHHLRWAILVSVRVQLHLNGLAD